MKNVITQKIALSLLITLVLAFGVPGGADAITRFTRTSSDYPLVAPQTDFTIRFGVTFTSTSTDSETARITVSGGSLKKVGNFDASGTTQDLTEGGTAGKGQLLSSHTLTLTSGAAGKMSVTISDRTSGDKANDLVFTIYVSPAFTSTNAPAFSSSSVTTARGDVKFSTSTPLTLSGEHIRLNYRVTGNGSVFIKEDGKDAGTTSKNLTTSSAAPVYVRMGGGTNRIAISIVGQRASSTIQATYIYGEETVQIVSGDKQTGAVGSALGQPFVVRLTDTANRPISGVNVTFDPETTDNDEAAIFIKDLGTPDDLHVAYGAGTTPFTTTQGQAVVKTNANGEAKAVWVLHRTAHALENVAHAHLSGRSSGSNASVAFQARAVAKNPVVSSIVIASGNGQSADQYGIIANPLVVSVRDSAGHLVKGQTVLFIALSGGTLSNSSDEEPGAASGSSSGASVTVTTDNRGQAGVRYAPSQVGGSQQVRASITGSASSVTFTVNGTRGTTPTTPTTTPDSTTPSTPTTPPPTDGGIVASRLRVVSGNQQTGAPGAVLNPFVVQLLDTDGDGIDLVEIDFEVVSGSGTLSDSMDQTDESGNARSTLTLGSSAGTVTVRVSVDSDEIGGRSISPVTFTATAEVTTLPPDAINIVGDETLTGDINEEIELTVQVVDADEDGVDFELVTFTVTEGNGRLRPSRDRTDEDGNASTFFTPTSPGTLEVRANSGDLDPVTFTITTSDPPDAITIISGNNQSGRPGARLANPFVVRVTDALDDPVAGVTVSFSVTAGGGSLSTQSATTNSNGRAQAVLTLGADSGNNTVTARVTGLTPVTFRAMSGAEVHVAAAQRPPMYWVGRAQGTLHRLVGAAVENLLPNVTGVTDIAVDAAQGALYFAVKVGENRGSIRSSALNGQNVRTIKTLTAVPNGIAVDAASQTVYWTNSRGRIQSIPATGSSKLTNEVQNISNPSAIAVYNQFVYWVELNRLRRASLTATPQTAETLATADGNIVSIAVAKGKIYWIESGVGGRGTLKRSNLAGKNVETLKTFASNVPTSVAVDSSDNKIYWTKGSGTIQRSNLAGKWTKNIVTGLANPSAIALGTITDNPTPAQPASLISEGTTPKKPTTSKYDVNGDGSVDDQDVTLVALALDGKYNAKYDVNGDKVVDAKDLRAVINNTEDTSAAPAINLDLKALDIDFDRVQAQIESVLVSDDMSPSTRRTLMYLQHLLATARPSETTLLTNYPNPFNPETWIPYQLADSTEVRINIYDAQGILIRALNLGHQTAGYYTHRSRAAYWDGRNALGEPVASGIYFYQLQTDTTSLMRKMVILK